MHRRLLTVWRAAALPPLNRALCSDLEGLATADGVPDEDEHCCHTGHRRPRRFYQPKSAEPTFQEAGWCYTLTIPPADAKIDESAAALYKRLGFTFAKLRDEQQSSQEVETMVSEGQRLQGKVALITGAARGIGRATAIKLASEGADIALLDIAQPVVPETITSHDDLPPATLADLEEATRLVTETGRRALMLQADVRDYIAMMEAVERTIAELGHIDIVVSNAGVVAWSPWVDMTPEHWQVVLDVNLTGTFNILKAATHHMVQRAQGCMITLSSIGGRQGVPGVANYATTKWGVIGLTKTLALELGPYNIRVNAVAPTAVNTPMFRSRGQARSTNPGKPDASAADQDVQVRANHALPVSAIESEEIANGIAFLCSDEARFISGNVLDIAAGGNARYTA